MQCGVVELAEDGFIKPLANVIGFWAFGLGAAMVDIFDRQIELVFMALVIATIFTAAIDQDADQWNITRSYAA